MESLEGGSQETILLVNGSSGCSDCVTEVLRNLYKVVVASNAEEARALYTKVQPRYVVTFMELPWMADQSTASRGASSYPQFIRLNPAETRPPASQWQSELVGRLAGGVAHEFNNLLTVIIGLTQLTAEEFPEGHPRRAAMETVVRAARRAALLTR